jgi:DNA polymerase-4
VTARAEPSILHVDLDAFFASVEQLDDPSLRGRPVIVGGTGMRGVVAAASYEARAYGVHSAMPTARARRACPEAAFLPPRFDRYSEKSEEVMAILRSYTPLVEQLSVDEAFLDVAGVRRRHGPPERVARQLKVAVHERTGLVVSVGVATTKFLAKLASDASKPDGLLVVEPGTELDFLGPLPVTRLWGVGPATFAKLERMGIATVADVRHLPPDVLVRALGPALGAHVHALALNDDPRPVVPERPVKTVGAEETFAADLRSADACDRELVRLASRVAARLRAAGVATRTVTLKVRYGDFETRTRSRTLARPTDGAADLLATARELLLGFDVDRGIRLLGISGSQLAPPPPEQGTLALGDTAGEHEAHRARQAAAERAADEARARFGARAVRPATLVCPPSVRAADGEERA